MAPGEDWSCPYISGKADDPVMTRGQSKLRQSFGRVLPGCNRRPVARIFPIDSSMAHEGGGVPEEVEMGREEVGSDRTNIFSDDNFLVWVRGASKYILALGWLACRTWELMKTTGVTHDTALLGWTYGKVAVLFSGASQREAPTIIPCMYRV